MQPRAPQPQGGLTARKQVLSSEHFLLFVVAENVEKKQENNL